MSVNKEFSLGKMQGELNNEGVNVSKYIPRKCSATSRILGPKDKSSIQFSIPKIDPLGRIIEGEIEETFAISGYLRAKGRSDWEIEKLLRSKGLYPLPDEE